MGDHNKILFVVLLVCLTFVCRTKSAVVRSDDPVASDALLQRLVQEVDDLKAKVAAQEQKIAAQNQKIASLESRKVAFTAYCDGNINPSGTSIIPFANIIANVGNAYNPATSVFTAPFDGVYFFIVDANVSADYLELKLWKNSQVVFEADKDDTVTTNVSGSAVVTLVAGDVVAIHHVASDTGFVECGRDSVFSGFLIY